MSDFNIGLLFKIPGCRVTKICFSENLRDISLRVKRRRKTADCLWCEKRTSYVHSYQKERKVLHRLLGQQRIYLVFTPRRFECRRCKRVFVEYLPFLKRRKRQTEDLLSDLLIELRGQCFKTVKEKTGVGYAVLRNYLLERVSPFVASWEKELSLPNIALGIDEHYFKNKQFVTTITNLTTHQVKTILPDDRKLTVIAFFKSIPEDIKEKIVEVCCDMDSGYIRAVYESLPFAKVVIDPFHVVQDANRRLNEFRKIEQDVRKTRINWKVFLKAKEHLNLKKREDQILKASLDAYPYLRAFYNYKETLRDIYKEKRKEDAQQKLTSLITILKSSDIVELNSWARTLTHYKTEILNHWDSETTNAYTEGIHVKMKMIQRISFGFRNLDVYVRKAMLAILPLALFVNHTY